MKAKNNGYLMNEEDEELRAKYEQILTKSLKKLTKTQLLAVIKIWNDSTSSIDDVIPDLSADEKKLLIERLVYEYFKDNISDREYAQLELKCNFFIQFFKINN